jgi:Polyketide cyclase / dehydrase and lipid transport
MVHSFRRTRGGPVAEQVIDETVMTAGDPAAVYALLADGSTWPDWSPLGTFELIAPGDGVPEGLGAVRLFTTGRHKSRERVVICEPGSVFAYELVSGLPLRDYRAVVTLAPGVNGTIINWRSTFRAKVPGSGGFYRRELGKFIRRTVEGLAAAAEPAPNA